VAATTGLAAQYSAATSDVTLIQRVEMAVLNAAQNIASEAVGSTPSANDAAHRPNRMALAKAVTQPGASAAYGAQFCKLIFAVGTLDISGSTFSQDTNIQNLVNACWNTVAGQV